MSDTKDMLRTALAFMFDNFRITSASIDHTKWGSLEYQFLEFCLRNNITNMKEVRSLVRKRIIKEGRQSYNTMISGARLCTQYADKCPSPLSFAYAIEAGEFTRKELSQITYHVNGGSAKTFMKKERAGFLDEIIRQLVDHINQEKESP